MGQKYSFTIWLDEDQVDRLDEWRRKQPTVPTRRSAGLGLFWGAFGEKVGGSSQSAAPAPKATPTPSATVALSASSRPVQPNFRSGQKDALKKLGEK
ncbi:MAG: hypothetical protein KGL39_39790 [Patescibacteria group bacterium]|nr:hypothetical protein [Patescibacteria group bacterium]